MIKFVDRLSEAEEVFRDRMLGPLVLFLMPRWIVPNHLTALRAILVFVAMIIYALGVPLQRQVAVLVIAALTDCFDGILARARSQYTQGGAYFDHAVDWFLGGWAGVLTLISGLLPMTFIILIALPQLGIVIVDRFRAARIAVEDKSKKVLTITMGAANFQPTAFARFQFTAILTGFFMLLLGATWSVSGLKYSGLVFLYAAAAMAWILLVDTVLRLRREQIAISNRSNEEG
jgi:phosphatidylglycerophosphate synthase